jgi:hypothetical protein
MKSSISHLHKFFLYFLVFQFILLLVSPVIYYVWVNFWIKESANVLDIPFLLSLSVCLYVCVTCWITISIYPINGIGKIKLQVYSSIFEMLLLIPVALWLRGILGVSGIVLAPVIIYIPRMIWAPIQLRKLINNKATGIWNE